MSLKPGDALNRYVVESVLGEGGMGQVVVANDTLLGRRVALKIIRLEGGEMTAESAERLLREARAIAALDHPNVVAVYDAGQADGIPYVAMEYVKGKTLRAYVGKADVPLAQRLGWLLDVARALEAAHERGLVHRDVKPDNVIVRDDGVAKLLDFGIARAAAPAASPYADTAANLATLTQEGAVIGTPMYMAPEQLQGERADGRADQFAWGVLAWELLVGRPPWCADGAYKLVTEILTGEPSGSIASISELHPDVASAVRRALRKEPSKRFASMTPVVETLAAATTGAIRTSRQRPWAPAVLIVALVVAAGVLATLRFKTPRVASTAASAPSATGTTVLDLPRPASSSPTAAAAYAGALQAYRDGVVEVQQLQEAVAADPSLAAAYLRLAKAARLGDFYQSRKWFQKAVDHRSSLSPRDARVLEAMEPCIARQPWDERECATRLGKLVESWPLDAELLSDAGISYAEVGELDRGIALLERAVEVDPDFARARGLLAWQYYYRGRFDDGDRTFDECIRRFARPTVCLYMKFFADSALGRCAELEKLAQAMIVTTPDFTPGYGFSAHAGYALNRPLETVRERLRQSRSKLPEPAQTYAQNMHEASLAGLSGDFETAESKAREARDAVKDSPIESDQVGPAMFLMAVYFETGRAQEASREAEHVAARRAAFLPTPRLENFAIADDATPHLADAMFRAGRLDRAARSDRLAQWAQGWRSRTHATYRSYIWMYGLAGAAHDEASASEALQSLPEYEPLAPFRPYKAIAEEAIGRTLLLAGRPADAIAPLRAAANSCRAIEYPIEHTQASLWLGKALEATNDRDGACKAYDTVISRWGHARPRSLSARQAAEGRKRLGCK